MALTEFQRAVCRLLAEIRVSSGESYVAGGAALNEWIAASRISRDVDIFHDSDEALVFSWRTDRELLESRGYRVSVLRERPVLVEAEVSAASDRVRLEWSRDSAFRFFPLQRHDDFGLTLHPFDLATNKVLALVGRLEPRDWVDVIACDGRLQPLGYLAWAACAKDPAFGPAAILEGAARSGRYSAEEIGELDFEGAPQDPAGLACSWHRILDSAGEVISLLAPEEAGTCVLTPSGDLFRGSPDELKESLRRGEVAYHAGRLRGALPLLKE